MIQKHIEAIEEFQATLKKDKRKGTNLIVQKLSKLQDRLNTNRVMKKNIERGIKRAEEIFNKQQAMEIERLANFDVGFRYLQDYYAGLKLLLENKTKKNKSKLKELIKQEHKVEEPEEE